MWWFGAWSPESSCPGLSLDSTLVCDLGQVSSLPHVLVISSFRRMIIIILCILCRVLANYRVHIYAKAFEPGQAHTTSSP